MILEAKLKFGAKNYRKLWVASYELLVMMNMAENSPFFYVMDFCMHNVKKLMVPLVFCC
jgi:hypothetical protein